MESMDITEDPPAMPTEPIAETVPKEEIAEPISETKKKRKKRTKKIKKEAGHPKYPR
jgi:hypothetical protein